MGVYGLLKLFFFFFLFSLVCQCYLCDQGIIYLKCKGEVGAVTFGHISSTWLSMFSILASLCMRLIATVLRGYPSGGTTRILWFPALFQLFFFSSSAHTHTHHSYYTTYLLLLNPTKETSNNPVYITTQSQTIY